jgi:hypothetical protein
MQRNHKYIDPWDFKRSLTCCKILRHGTFPLYFSSEGRCAADFIALKSATMAGFEPATFGSSGKHTNHYTTQDTHKQVKLRLLRDTQFMMIMSMGWDDVSELRPTTGLLFIPRWDMSVEKYGGIMSTEENSWFIHQSPLAILPAVFW